jgi:hypothetical protein
MLFYTKTDVQFFQHKVAFNLPSSGQLKRCFFCSVNLVLCYNTTFKGILNKLHAINFPLVCVITMKPWDSLFLGSTIIATFLTSIYQP